MAGVVLALAALAAVPALLGRETAAGFEVVAVTACALDKDGSADIIIAGDSRAKGQADPLILSARSGKPSVNIAENLNLGGDLPTLVNVLRQRPELLAGHPLLLISVSTDGVNDCSFPNTPGAALFNYRPWEHARLVWRMPGEYPGFFASWFVPAVKRGLQHKWRGDGFACDGEVYLSPALLASRGFRPMTGLRVPTGKGKPARYLIDGARWRLFQASLAWLEASPARAVVLFDAPFSPDSVVNRRGTPAGEMELRFADQVRTAVAGRPKLRFLDFVSHGLPEFTTPDFVDAGHLRPQAAVRFTGMLADSLGLPP